MKTSRPAGGRPITEILEDCYLPQIKNPTLLNFFEIWMDLSGKELPRQRDANLEIFGQHVRNMLRGDFNREVGRFRISFIGSQNSRNIGADYTGQFADEMSGTSTLMLRTKRLIETRKPYMVSNVQLTWGPRDFQFYDVLACPLFDKDDRVSSVLYVNDFHHRPDPLAA